MGHTWGHTSCAAPQIPAVSRTARAARCFPGAKAQWQSPPSCCQCHTVVKNSHGALAAMANCSVQLHDAGQNAISKDALGHPCPHPQHTSQY